MANLTQIATATVSSQNIGAGLVQVFSSTLTGGANIEAIATIQVSSRGGGATANIRVKATVGGRLLADNLVGYTGTATASMEIQTLPFRWANGEALAISISSSDAADSAVNVTTIVDTPVGADLAKVFRWLGIIAGKGSDPATLAEIQSTDGGETFDNATDSLEAAAETGATVNVLPAVGISASRAPGVFLSPFVGELISQSITVYASDGTTAIDLSGKTLEIVFEARGGGDVAVIANANITISGGDDNVVTFAYPSAVTAQERTLRFSLRDAGSPFTVYLTGLCKVSIAPSNDPA